MGATDKNEVCNEDFDAKDATANTDTCLATKDLMDATNPKQAYRTEGDAKKWCFATDDAEKCAADHICNPHGAKATNADATLICVPTGADTNRSVAHGEAVLDTGDVNLCIGNLASNKAVLTG